MSPTIAYTSHGTQLMIVIGVTDYRFDQVRTIVVDHANGWMRGNAISSSSEVQAELRKLRRGDPVYLSLITPERQEYKGRAEVVMIRIRATAGHAITLSFIFRLLDLDQLQRTA